MSLERDLIVFGRVAVELSRIEQWKISADHGFFSNAPLGARAAVKRPRPPASGRLNSEAADHRERS
jgi:hypothetical protein